MGSSNVEWQRWGQVDPLYGVSTAKGRERGGKQPWTAAEFYERGRLHWDRFHPPWQRYGLDLTRCLEIGCGTGMTAQLARVFTGVDAVDVSQGMIDYAAAHVAAANVRYHLTDGAALPVPSGSVTAVFSTHVFQHFDSIDQATQAFREVARVLAPGGTLMIHLPIFRWPLGNMGFDLAYRLRKRMGNVRAHLLRLLIARGLVRPVMRYLSYPAEYPFRTLPALGLVDVEIDIIAAEADGDLHPFVMARRASDDDRLNPSTDPA